jgi:serralysin
MNFNITRPAVIGSKLGTELVLDLADSGNLSLNIGSAHGKMRLQRNRLLAANISINATASSELQIPTALSPSITQESKSIPTNTLTAYRFGFGTATTATSPATVSTEPIHYSDINALLSKKHWLKAPVSQGPTTVTFSFTDSANDYEFNGDYLKNDSELSAERRTELLKQYKSKFQVLNTEQKAVVRSWLLNDYYNVSNLIFTELTGANDADATIRIARADIPASVPSSVAGTSIDLRPYNQNHAFLPGIPSDVVESGDVWYRSDIGASPKIGSYGYFTIGHELGHSLGLKHGHESNPLQALTNNKLSDDRDSIEFSIMTYRPYINGSIATPEQGFPIEQFSYAQTLMMYDIRAIQQMYGAWFNYQPTNTVYKFSTITGEMFINGVSQGVPGANRIFRTIWDGNGLDTYDFSNYTTSLSINLTPGGWVDLHVGGNNQRANLDTKNAGRYARAHVFNALQYQGDVRSLIENANGGSGNDSIQGNIASNTLNGNNGNDMIDGGDGSDILIGGNGNDVLVGNSGNDNLLGGTGNDSIYGDSMLVLGSAVIIGNDTVSGGDGDDLIESRGGNDFVTGDGGVDFIFGGAGNDTINGGLGNDRIDGEAENDSILGGAGNDVLRGGTGNDIVSGDDGDDSLFGGDGNDMLTGGSGNDILYGEGGNDMLDGGIGNDSLLGTFGDIKLDGGIGIDTLKFLTAANSPADLNSYSINLTTGATNYGGLALNFENLFTNSGNDTLVGSAANNLIESGAGNDRINGGAGNDQLVGSDGIDTIYGDAGNDTIDGGFGNSSGNDLLYGGAGVDAFILSRVGVDTISDFVSLGSPTEIDYLVVSASAFGLVDPPFGYLNSGSLRVGAGATTATNASQRFIFNTTDRSLYFDAGGNTGASSVKIAVLSSTATINSSNFSVIF